MNMIILLMLQIIPIKLNQFDFKGMKSIRNWGLTCVRLKSTTLERFLIFDHKHTIGQPTHTFH